MAESRTSKVSHISAQIGLLWLLCTYQVQSAGEADDFKPENKKQSGSVKSGELELLEKEKEELADSLRDHKQVARESLQYYKSMKEKCAKQWQAIAELQKKIT